MIKTEMRNERTKHIDTMTTTEMLSAISAENFNAAKAVDAVLPQIAQAVDAVAQAFENGGKLFYIGAGTSGRLGVLDASECPPTYGVSYEQVQGILAGGKECMFRASENAEDNEAQGAKDISVHGICEKDVVVGISVAGGAAYVVGALKETKKRGGVAIALTCNTDTPIERVSDITIITDTGAEPITGSTRMKAGTAHKMVLNMISTCAMVKTGKVYENLMINLRPSNIKLKNPMVRIVGDIVGCDETRATELLEKHGWNIRNVVDKEMN